MSDFSNLSDDELEREIFNSDAADQDEIASDLFLEIVRRYKNKKSELEKSDDLVTLWQEKYENKKKECERLRQEAERLQVIYPRLTDWEWFLRPYQAS